MISKKIFAQKSDHGTESLVFCYGLLLVKQILEERCDLLFMMPYDGFMNMSAQAQKQTPSTSRGELSCSPGAVLDLGCAVRTNRGGGGRFRSSKRWSDWKFFVWKALESSVLVLAIDMFDVYLESGD